MQHAFIAAGRRLVESASAERFVAVPDVSRLLPPPATLFDAFERPQEVREAF
jgi:hypothetical protein